LVGTIVVPHLRRAMNLGALKLKQQPVKVPKMFKLNIELNK
jgi:hypothetical protein